MKSMHIAVFVAALCTVGMGAAQAQQKSSSYKSGFSSQRSTSSSKSSQYKAPAPSRSSSSFGSFSSRQSAAPAPSRPSPTSFGSFGSRSAASNTSGSSVSGATQAPRRSNSAMSRSLDQSASQAQAMRTYESRRAAQEIPRAPVIAPTPYQGSTASNSSSYDQSARTAARQKEMQRSRDAYSQPYVAPRTTPQPRYNDQPQVVRQGDNGAGNILTGVLIGQAISKPAQSAPSAPVTVAPTPVLTSGTPALAQASNQASSGFGFLATIFTLMALAGAGYFAYKFLSKSAATPQGPNYSLGNN